MITQKESQKYLLDCKLLTFIYQVVQESDLKLILPFK